MDGSTVNNNATGDHQYKDIVIFEYTRREFQLLVGEMKAIQTKLFAEFGFSARTLAIGTVLEFLDPQLRLEYEKEREGKDVLMFLNYLIDYIDIERSWGVENYEDAVDESNSFSLFE